MIALQIVAISKYRVRTITHFLNSVPKDSLIANSNDTPVTKHADWFTLDSSMTIKDLLSCSEPGTYITIAEIQDIDTMNWYYDSCSKCRKKPKKGSKKPPAIIGETCESCFQVIDGLMYRIKLEAKDSTGQTFFILLDQQARDILKKSAADMLADSGKKGHAPEEFDKFFENEWIFRVQVQQEYNIIDKKTEYSVMNISNDQNLIAQFAKEKSCEDSSLTASKGHHVVVERFTHTVSQVSVGDAVEEISSNSLLNCFVTPQKRSSGTLDGSEPNYGIEGYSVTKIPKKEK
ncbi:hypothetical protein OROGR_020278 [Orobanche gracilis]